MNNEEIKEELKNLRIMLYWAMFGMGVGLGILLGMLLMLLWS